MSVVWRNKLDVNKLPAERKGGSPDRQILKSTENNRRDSIGNVNLPMVKARKGKENIATKILWVRNNIIRRWRQGINKPSITPCLVMYKGLKEFLVSSITGLIWFLARYKGHGSQEMDDYNAICEPSLCILHTTRINWVKPSLRDLGLEKVCGI